MFVVVFPMTQGKCTYILYKILAYSLLAFIEAYESGVLRRLCENMSVDIPRWTLGQGPETYQDDHKYGHRGNL